jgi:HSP20 family protein
MTTKESLLPSVGFLSTPAIRRFRSELDSLFEGFFSKDWGFDVSVFEDMQPKGSFPKVNVSETDDGYNAEIAVAGFNKDEMQLMLKDNDLIISAEKSEESNNDEEKEDSCRYLCREIAHRSFKRVIRFPHPVDVDTLNAEYKDGMIKFSVSKKNVIENKDAITIEIK